MIYGFSLLSLVSSGFESQSDVPRSGFHEDLHAAMLPLQGLRAAVPSRRATSKHCLAHKRLKKTKHFLFFVLDLHQHCCY